MAKDPAVLWYWNDWHSATTLYSRFLKGCYMDLLHAQFNNGRLSLEEIKICLGADFGSSWPTLQKKFKQDETGLFFNERLEREKLKREAFTKKQSLNGKMGGRPPSNKPKNNPSLKPNESLLENENENRKEKGGVGEKEKQFPDLSTVELAFTQQGGTKEMANKFFNSHSATGWQIRGQQIKNFTYLIPNFISTWYEIKNKNGKSVEQQDAEIFKQMGL